jgi:hypothetical protein
MPVQGCRAAQGITVVVVIKGTAMAAATIVALWPAFRSMSWETLDRIAADGSTLEVQSGVRKINPKGPRHSIYYRP